MHNKPIIDIPAAPLASGNEDALKRPFVSIYMLDGSISHGALYEFISAVMSFVIKMDNGDLQRIDINNLRYMVFDEELKKAPVDNLKNDPAVKFYPSLSQDYRIDFIDGKSLSGKTRDSIIDEHCIHLFDVNSKENIHRILIPHKAITKYKIGLLNGEVVVKDSEINSKLAKAVVNHHGMNGGRSDYYIPEHDGHVSTHDADLELKQVLQGFKKSKSIFGKVQKNARHVSNENIYITLAKKFDLPYINIIDYKINPDMVDYIPYDIAKKVNAMPLRFDNNRLFIAISNPTDNEGINLLRFVSVHNIELIISNEDGIKSAIDKYYGNIDSDNIIEKISAEKEKKAEIPASEFEEIGSEKPMVQLVNNILLDAVNKKASDIHIHPEEGYIDLIYRIDGTLIKIRKLNKALLPALVSRIKIIGNMNIAERRLPQDGRAKLKVDDTSTVDLRLSVMPTIDGESVVARILNINVGLKTILDLGLSKKQEEDLLDTLHKSYGIFLVTGPTGSGKSTTLYAAIEEIQKQNVNVITIEDPVEYHMEHIEQIQVNHKTGYSFARALRNILRHDPDVIMVGEIRDEETAKIAVESALTGHLVLSTLHTNDAPSAITRLLEMGVESYLLSSSLLGVLAQRLTRKNCINCLAIEKIDKNLRKIIGVDNDEVFYKGQGCKECNYTGYKGRVGVYELLIVSNGVRDKIKSGVSVEEIRSVTMSGMIPLTKNALALARKKEIPFSEVYRVRLE